jgi:hypothetical protein
MDEQGRNCWRDSFNQTLIGVHSETDDCREHGCCIHNPSDHPLRDQPQVWRDQRYRSDVQYYEPPHMVRVCEHGLDHPDPDALAWQRRSGEADLADYLAIHPCDGCCGQPATGDDFCLKCKGKGTYPYDENHGTICDLCCPHDQGSWLLPEGYNKEGQWCCRAGCGHTRDEEWGNE